MTINATQTVRELAVTLPGATRVFEQFGIDYCCGGARTLGDACQTANLSFTTIAHSLAQAEQTGAAKQPVWQGESLTALAAYIVDGHHFFTKLELSRVSKLFAKVCAQHGANHPELFAAQELWQQLKRELIPHMLKEEQVLFPYIARLEEAALEQCAVAQPFFGTVQNPVRKMTEEHDAAGDLLAELRRATNNYTAPADGCISFQTLYQALLGFEADLHQHIHLENNILFPRAVELEERTAPELQHAGSEFACAGH
jgi:regulator of cell morphogenesis and NO signaling